MPSASNNVHIAEKETFKGEMTTAPSGKKLINFKQNMAGYVSFKINAKKGQKITLRFGEMLDENGEPDAEEHSMLKQKNHHTFANN